MGLQYGESGGRGTDGALQAAGQRRDIGVIGHERDQAAGQLPVIDDTVGDGEVVGKLAGVQRRRRAAALNLWPPGRSP
jgi:hypothetical protein